MPANGRGADAAPTLFDYMDQAEIPADEPAALPAVAVPHPEPAVTAQDRRIARLADAGLDAAIGLETDHAAGIPLPPSEWQAALLHDLVARPALAGESRVTVRLDDLVDWCREKFGGEARGDGHDWSTSPEFRAVDAYMACLVGRGTLADAPGRLGYAVPAHTMAAFSGGPAPAPSTPYWWETMGMNVRGMLRGNTSVVARDINEALARADELWRDFDLDGCLAAADEALSHGREICTDPEDDLLRFLETIRNWIDGERLRRDLGGGRWWPYRDGAVPVPAETVHSRIMGEARPDQGGRDEARQG
jgi:hypothetical protein